MMTLGWNCAEHLGFEVFENCLSYRVFVLHSGNIRRYLRVKKWWCSKYLTLGIGSNGRTNRWAFFTFFLKILQNFESPVFAAPRVMHRIRSVKTSSRDWDKSTAQRVARAPPSECPVIRIFGGLYSARLKSVFVKSLSRTALKVSNKTNQFKKPFNFETPLNTADETHDELFLRKKVLFSLSNLASHLLNWIHQPS